MTKLRATLEEHAAGSRGTPSQLLVDHTTETPVEGNCLFTTGCYIIASEMLSLISSTITRQVFSSELGDSLIQPCYCVGISEGCFIFDFVSLSLEVDWPI